MRAVICGVGIAGLTAAWWLDRQGWQVLVAADPGRRFEDLDSVPQPLPLVCRDKSRDTGSENGHLPAPAPAGGPRKPVGISSPAMAAIPGLYAIPI